MIYWERPLIMCVCLALACGSPSVKGTPGGRTLYLETLALDIPPALEVSQETVAGEQYQYVVRRPGESNALLVIVVNGSARYEKKTEAIDIVIAGNSGRDYRWTDAKLGLVRVIELDVPRPINNGPSDVVMVTLAYGGLVKSDLQLVEALVGKIHKGHEK